MHSAGFVDILKYCASAALFTSLWSYCVNIKKASNQRIFYCLKYGSLIIKISQPKDVGLRLKISKKHEANSLPVDIKVVHICTFTHFFKVSERRCGHLTITRLRKRSPLVVAIHPHLLPFCLVLCSLLTLMVSK